MGHFMNTAFSGIFGCILNTPFRGIAMILGALSLLMLGLRAAYKTQNAFNRGRLDLSRSARGSTGPSALGCSGCSETSSAAGSISQRHVATAEHGASMHADGGVLADVDIKKTVWTWPWASNPLDRTGASKISHFLHVVLRSVFIASIMVYQAILRPSMFGSCRFYPTCSVYAIDAFRQYGLMPAIILIVWRIIRCNPWGPCGYDPVPSSLFSSS